MPLSTANWEKVMLSQVRIKQIENGAQVVGLVTELGEKYIKGSITRRELDVGLVAAEKLGFTKSANTSANYLTEARRRYEVAGEVEKARFDSAVAARRAESTVETLGRIDDVETVRKIFKTAAAWTEKAAKKGGRKTVMQSAEASGRRWRRVTDVDPCAFCAMMATRGFLDSGYGSKTTALTRSSDDESFHDYCGCSVAEVIADPEPTATEKKWISIYEDAAKTLNTDGYSASTEEILSWIRENGSFNDSTSRSSDE